MKRRLPISLALIVPAFLIAAPTASAQSFAQSFTPGEARDAVRSGDTIPLREIFAQLEDRYGGYQRDAELFSTASGQLEYRIEWMSEDGRRLYIRIDAQSGRVISSSGD